MGKGQCMARSKGKKKFKRCCTNLKRSLKKAFTCGGKTPRCCRRLKRKCRTLFGPCCTRCNLCEFRRKCGRWARRCVCKQRQGPRRVAHVDYYKVKKRRYKRRSGDTEEKTEDPNRVFTVAVSTHSKLDTAVRDKNTKEAESKSNHKVTPKIEKKKAVEGGTSTNV